MLLTLLAMTVIPGKALNLSSIQIKADIPDLYRDGPYDPAVPTPESILGYKAGERHSTFRDQERVVMGIAAAAPTRVKLIEYGKSTEGRPLRVFAISSAANIARLDQIQKEHADLAMGKGDPTKTVPIVWINECIHGDETASFESGMWTMYNLAAATSGRLAGALDKEVVILNPVYNPDGHERYVVYYNSVATGSSDPYSFESTSPNVMRGRLNHYRFDMNRDRVAFSQDETRAEFAEMLRWGPQVYIDQHGQVGSYFFPPEPMAINPNVDRARNTKWTEIFGKATAKAFDQKGYSYFTKNEFDLWYPGYLDASTTLSGAIGMTHETDGGRTLASKRPDGTTLTLLHGIEKHFTSALTVAVTTATHATDLLKDYADFKRKAVRGDLSGPFKHVVVSADDPRPLQRLRDHLRLAGIDSNLIQGTITSKSAHDFWSSDVKAMTSGPYSLEVDMTQPQAAMAKALLEPTTEFEPEFVKAQVAMRKTAPDGERYPGPEGTEFYDFTGWSLPYAYSLPAFWTDKIDSSKTNWSLRPVSIDPSPIGYVLRYRDQEDILAVADLLQSGVKCLVPNKPMVLDGQTYPAGSFIFLTERNGSDLRDQLQTEMSRRPVHFEALKTAYPDQDRFSPGSNSVSLRVPSIAVVMGRPGNLAESGYVWYLMDRQFKLPFTPITESALSGNDLNQFTCVVLPEGVQAPTSGHFKEWIEAGNVAVSFGPASDLAALERVKGEFQELPGSLFRAEVDSRSFLGYGYPVSSGGKIEVGVPVQGSQFFKQKKEGGSVVNFSSDPAKVKLLSGWSWPDETEKALTGAVFTQDTPVGQGHFVLFTSDPTERALWPGLYKLLLNSMIIGSGN